MSIYLLAAVNKQDVEKYAGYEAGAFESVVKFGVEALAVDDSPNALEGALPARRIVLLKFTDEKALKTWYESKEYQAARKIRLEAAETPFIITFQGLS